MNRRIRINGQLYEQVSSSSKVRPFLNREYKLFDIEDYPKQDTYLFEPLVYWKGGSWRKDDRDNVAAIALIGLEDFSYGDYKEPVAYIDLRWPLGNGKVRSMTRDFFYVPDARETFNKMLKDIDTMNPKDLAKKYRLSIDE